MSDRPDEPETLTDVPLPRAEAPAAPPRLLTDPRFLLLVAGDGFAGLGRWAFFLAAVGDATYVLHVSPARVALLLGVFSLALILASPLYGLLADRRSAKWLLVVTTAATVPVPLIALRTDSYAWLLVASALFGALHAAVQPARGALVPRLVHADRLVAANGMISGALAAQLVIGPALAALLVRLLGRDAPYIVTLGGAALAAIAYLFVPDRRAATSGRAAFLAEIAAGFREGWRKIELRRLFFLAIAVWFLIGVLISLEPAYIREELGRGQVFLGVVWAVYGGGEVVGAIGLARLRRAAGREPQLVAGGLLLAALGFLVYVSVRSPVAVLAGNVVFGIGFPLFTATSQALIQRIAVAPGRVSAAFSMT
ncbi:MAG TPA: MFS transporter, partial [Actinomycetota bacterium]|nr:MFS transporter [Actinomycetota bacterium]